MDHIVVAVQSSVIPIIIFNYLGAAPQNRWVLKTDHMLDLCVRLAEDQTIAGSIRATEAQPRT